MSRKSEVLVQVIAGSPFDADDIAQELYRTIVSSPANLHDLTITVDNEVLSRKELELQRQKWLASQTKK